MLAVTSLTTCCWPVVDIPAAYAEAEAEVPTSNYVMADPFVESSGYGTIPMRQSPTAAGEAYAEPR